MNALGVSLDNRYFAPLLEWTKFGLTRISPQEFAMQKHVCSEVQFFWQKWQKNGRNMVHLRLFKILAKNALQ